MLTAQKRTLERKRRSERIRKKILGSAERPRLCVRRSLNGIYAQIIDDTKGISIVQVGSAAASVRELIGQKKDISKTEIAKLVGEQIAAKAKEKGVEKVVFDRRGYLYHGRVKALADGARSKGLKF